MKTLVGFEFPQWLLVKKIEYCDECPFYDGGDMGYENSCGLDKDLELENGEFDPKIPEGCPLPNVKGVDSNTGEVKK